MYCNTSFQSSHLLPFPIPYIIYLATATNEIVTFILLANFEMFWPRSMCFHRSTATRTTIWQCEKPNRTCSEQGRMCVSAFLRPPREHSVNDLNASTTATATKRTEIELRTQWNQIETIWPKASWESVQYNLPESRNWSLSLLSFSLTLDCDSRIANVN